MKTQFDQLGGIVFPASADALFDALEQAYEIVVGELTGPQQLLLRQDFDFYKEQGRSLVHNTFAGGIIFLREPEIIQQLTIGFSSFLNNAVVAVTYGSGERNGRNVKYKPEAGAIESTTWDLMGIFPNFTVHASEVKVCLVALIGLIAKCICEHYRRTSWFMKYEKAFEIRLLLDGEAVGRYPVEIDPIIC